jgi:hypothetical protein
MISDHKSTLLPSPAQASTPAFQNTLSPKDFCTNDGFQNRYLKNLQFLTVNYLCNSEAPAAVTFLLLFKVKEVELIYGQKSLLKKKEEEEDNHFNNNNSNPFTKGGEDKKHPKIK